MKQWLFSERNLLYDIVIAVIGVILGVAFTWMHAKLKELRKKRRVTRFWSLKADGLTVFHPTMSSQEFDGQDGYYMYYNHFLAIHLISAHLGRYTKRLSVLTELAKVDRSQNLLVIGGPIRNELTKEVCEELKPPFYFYGLDPRNRVITNEASTIQFKSEFDNNDLAYDIGFFIRARNPFKRDRTVIVAAGNYTAGTYGVVSFLTNPKNLKTIKLLGNDAAAEGIIGIRVKDSRLLEPKLLHLTYFDG